MSKHLRGLILLIICISNDVHSERKRPKKGSTDSVESKLYQKTLIAPSLDLSVTPLLGDIPDNDSYSLFRNSFAVSYFHNGPAVFGLKLGYFEHIRMTEDLALKLGLGFSFARGVEGYKESGLTTQGRYKSIQEGLGFQSDVYFPLEVACKFKELSFRVGFQLSHVIMNSIRNAEWGRANGNSFFYVVHKHNKFDALNKVGYVMSGGIDYFITPKIGLGLGVWKRLNEYVKDELFLSTKNNIALEFEFRFTKLFY